MVHATRFGGTSKSEPPVICALINFDYKYHLLFYTLLSHNLFQFFILLLLEVGIEPDPMVLKAVPGLGVSPGSTQEYEILEIKSELAAYKLCTLLPILSF